MAKPTQSILPIENGKLTTNLDCNNLQLINLDASNLNIPSGGGDGGEIVLTIDPTNGAVISNSSSQAIPNLTITYISFDTEVSDVGDLYDSSFPTRLTAPTDGFYTITAAILFEEPPTTGRRLGVLQVNHLTEIARVEVDTSTLANHGINLAATHFMSAGDYVEVSAYQTSGGDLDVIGGVANIQSPFLSMVGGEITGSGTGGGGTGNDTGTTTAILKGDGDHGFADAVADTDYASVTSVALKEDATTHDADILAVNTDIDALTTQVATNTSDIALKADSDDVTTALALKADEADLSAYITSNDAAVALKADSTDVTDALALKADTSALTAGLASKEDLLPTSANDGFVLVRDADETWRFVDPVTLGSTNATYADGATHSNTTFNSTLAVFTTNDTGKTIVCAGNIPDDTTITFVDANTVTLSNAATTTASALTFVILNRFLPSGGGGTVISVGVTNNITSLLKTSVGNATNSAVITIAPPDSTPIHSFYGNSSGSTGTAPIFMDAGQARNNLGGTVVGQAIFQVLSIGAESYVKVTTGNTAVMLNRADVRTDLGVETALTFNAPLARGTGSNTQVISIPAATTSVSGYLTSTDWNTFNSKAAGTITLTTTTPLTIDGSPSANLTQSRTLAMPASAGAADGTGQVNGYLTGTDHTLFANKPPNTRTYAVTAPLTLSPGNQVGNVTTGDLSANRTIAMPAATATVDGYLSATDFKKFAVGSGVVVTVGNVGTLVIDSAANPPVSRILLTAVLTQQLNITLPLANVYTTAIGSGGIEIIDIVGGATANFAVRLLIAGSNTIDGAANVTLPKSTTSLYRKLYSDGVNKWSSTNYFTTAFTDPLSPTKSVNVDVSGQSIISGTHTVPFVWRPATAGDSGSTIQKDKVAGKFFSAYDATTGVFGTDFVNVKDLVSTQADILAASIDGSNAYSVASDGSVDTVRLSATIPKVAQATGAPALTITFPPAANYGPGEVVRFYDASGSISATNYVRIIRPASGAGSTDTFNGSDTGTVITEAFANRTFVSSGPATSPAISTWSVSTYSSTPNVIGYAGLLQETGTTLTWPITPGAPTQTAYALPANSDSLAIGPSDLAPGMRFELIYRQPVGGGKTLTVPSGSLTLGTDPTGGLGLVPLASGSAAVTRVSGIYTGVSGLSWLWRSEFAYTASASVNCSAQVDLGGTWSSAAVTQSTVIGNQSTRRFVAVKYTPTSSAFICGIKIPVWGVGPPPAGFILSCSIYDDNGAGLPASSAMQTSGVTFAPATIPVGDNTTGPGLAVASPRSFTFAPSVSLTIGHQYWIVCSVSSTSGGGTNNYKWLSSGTNGGVAISSDGITWPTAATPNGLRPNFETLKVP